MYHAANTKARTRELHPEFDVSDNIDVNRKARKLLLETREYKTIGNKQLVRCGYSYEHVQKLLIQLFPRDRKVSLAKLKELDKAIISKFKPEKRTS